MKTESAESTEKTAEELRLTLNQSQGALQEALEDLESRARSELDLGRRIAEHAPIVLGVSFFVGFLFGLRRPSIRL